MHNFYYCVLIGITFLKILIYSVSITKIDNTLSLINECLVVGTITEQSKMEAYSYNNISLLAINKKLLKEEIYTILDSNLKFCQTTASYYFYDKDSMIPSYTNYNDANSVQIKIEINYSGREFIKVFRYEPISL